jgi:radical SAM superfamily enzyme YgiQ (UPF0313 family)
MRVVLADLGHNQVTQSSDIYPLGIANLATYAREYTALREPLDITLIREPQDLKAALDSAPPDVLGLSSYAWNHELALHFARYARRRRPDVLVLMGGPNFPLDEGEQERFLRSIPEVDIAVRGPTYEGERAFVNVLRRYSEAGHSLQEAQAEPVAGGTWINRKTGDFVKGPAVDRIRDLDEIPSPYLAGLLDPFLSSGYFPILQISRGCPFTCAFCNSSVISNSKIYRHSRENVEADLLYLAQRIRPEVPLCFADDNFGMYPWDEEIADYIRYLQDTYNWPQYIRTTTGKNNHERIIRVMHKTKAILPMTMAVQSLNPDTLQNIRRSNISLESYAAVQQEAHDLGIQSYGELILCLPGETKATFMQGLQDLLETGVKRVSAHQLMLVHGAPLSNPDSRQQWGFRSRFRIVARNIGNYTGEPVTEVEEVVVETPTFSFDDYLEMRVLHLLITIYYYEGNYEEAFEFVRHNGVKAFDLIRHLQARLDQAPPGIRQLITDFLQESREELFDSKEACLASAREHFASLVDGSLGGNLLSKYSMIGRFIQTEASLDFLKTGIQEVLGLAEGSPKADQLEAIIDYLHTVLLRVPFRDSLAAEPTWTTLYDVRAWQQGGYTAPLDAFRHTEPLTLFTTVEPRKRALLENRLATFGEHPAGLGKFTRTLFAHDLRRSLIANPADTAMLEEVAS